MTVEIFTEEEFDAVMCSAAEQVGAEAVGLGMKKGQMTWLLDFADGTGIEVGSSVDFDGVSRESGDDSIRLWLVTISDRDSLVDTIVTRPLGVKVDRGTQRITGWQGRTIKKVAILANRRRQSGNCPCGKPKGVFKVKNGKNKGKIYAACPTRPHYKQSFQWINDDVPEPTPAPKPEQKQTPEEYFGQLFGESKADAALAGGLTDLLADKPMVAVKSYETPNIHQRAMIDFRVAGPSVGEACPGSGKTFTGEHIIADLIANGENPDRMGYFTFSNPAAKESRRRIAERLFAEEGLTVAELNYLEDPHNKRAIEALGMSKTDLEEWQQDPRRKMIIERVATIHALCYRLLRWSGYKLNVLDGEWSWKEQELIKDALDELGWNDSIKAVCSWISDAICALVTPDKSEEWFAAELTRKGGPVKQAGNLATVYARRQTFMKEHNLIDYDMMQSRVVFLLENDRKFADWAAGIFDVIVVDEAQDTSPIQAKVLFHLVSRTGRIMFLGDVDQAMYGFRGAQPAIMRELFDRHWGADRVTRFNLPVNYRSTERIIDWSAKLIADNYTQDGEYLKAFEAKPGALAGMAIEYAEFNTFDELCSEATALVTERPGDWFFLSRTRAECSLAHMALVKAGVPAINMSGGLLLGAPHVRKALAYLRLACNYQDAKNNEDILGEIANVATRDFVAPMTHRRHDDGCKNTKPWINCGCTIIREKGVSTSHARYYGRKAVGEAGGRWSGIEAQTTDTVWDKDSKRRVPSVKAQGATDLVDFVERLEDKSDNAIACLETIIQECILPYLAAKEGIANDDLAENSKVEDLQVLAELVSHPDMTVKQYLQEIDRLASGETEEGEAESVIVATFHWSKGNQRPSVLANTTRLPIVPPSTPEDKLPTGVPSTDEEERRLLFVAATRAQATLHIMGSREWMEMETTPDFFVN